jgi:PAS domain S-box-containing protein
MPLPAQARALTCRVLAGEPLLVEWKCRRPDGSLFDGELSMKALTVGSERLLQCLVRDISERKRVLQALQQSEERFEKAFHLSPEPMSILDIQGRHVDINNVALQKIEYPREQVLGRTAEEIGIAIEPSADILNEFRSGAPIRNRERQFRTASGKVITVLLSAELIQIGGQPTFL